MSAPEECTFDGLCPAPAWYLWALENGWREQELSGLIAEQLPEWHVFAHRDVIVSWCRDGSRQTQQRVLGMGGIRAANEVLNELPGHWDMSRAIDRGLPCTQGCARPKCPQCKPAGCKAGKCKIKPEKWKTNCKHRERGVYELPKAPSGWIELWTDGSGTVAETPGGSGVVVVVDGEALVEASVPHALATNNYSELYAIRRALELLYELSWGDRQAPAILYSDSQWCLGATDPECTWMLKAGVLRELVLKVRKQRAYFTQLVTVHVPGHFGLRWNERADELAGRARKSQLREVA